MATQTAAELGAMGELVAARHLAGLGWAVLQRNWRCSEGELDIVARDLKGTIVFVEVKCRRGLAYGDPLEAITWAKLAKLRQLAAVWLREHGERAASIRLDAVGVLVDRDGRTQLRHVEGIS